MPTKLEDADARGAAVSPESLQRIPASEAQPKGETTCCVVGAGPAGAVLALLLARQGIDVTLIEAHQDFDRDFRGDTLMPSTMEIMDQLGLADRLIEMSDATISHYMVQTPAGSFPAWDMRSLKTKYPYITLMPQSRFLPAIVTEAQRYASFKLLGGATVEGLLEQDGRVCGVRYRAKDGWHELRASLVIGADGRFSVVRRLAGFQPVQNAQSIDILWFRVPRQEGDEQLKGKVFTGNGHVLFPFDRGDQWQIAYSMPKGAYRQLRDGGIEALRASIANVVPALTSNVSHLRDWKQTSMLSVESSRVSCWHRPGLLVIGDAAHVMSPVGGVGINYAIQDAVVTANVLSGPLRGGNVKDSHLARVQRQRELPTRVMQAMQNLILRQLLSGTTASAVPWPVRLLLRTPLMYRLRSRAVGLGVRRVRLQAQG